MAYSVIKKPSDYFNTKLYTGNSTDNHAITGVNFQPDLVWIKRRNQAANHNLFDAVRGVTKTIKSNLTNAEATVADTLKSFDSDGFTLGDDATVGEVNPNTYTMASWNWLAGGTASSNTDGSITSSVSANQDAGFSIVKWTNNTSDVQTIGHGLGVKPDVIILKTLTVVQDWRVYHKNYGATSFLKLNTSDAVATASSIWNNTEPTTSVFTTGTGSQMINNTLVAYCFAEKQGYSKFGSYTGNGSTDGTFVYTGFSPAFVMVKRTDSANSWNIKDNRRNNASTSFNINPRNATLLPNDSAADQDANALDFLSNGFKNKSTGNDVNNASGTYIYMAFAEEPLVGDNPATAR